MRSQDDPTPILLDYIQCTGSEKRLTDCVKSEQSNCDHTRDAGLVCREGMYGVEDPKTKEL